MATQAGLCAEPGPQRPVNARHTIGDFIAEVGARPPNSGVSAKA